MAVIDNGSSATLFISMAGFGTAVARRCSIRRRNGYPVDGAATRRAVLRLDLSIPDGQAPVLVRIRPSSATGFAQRADRDNFLLGPTGQALSTRTTPSMSPTASTTSSPRSLTRSTRTTSADGDGQARSRKARLLAWPLAMTWSPERPSAGLQWQERSGWSKSIRSAGRQIYGQWIDSTIRHSLPPGNGDLFGIALTPDGTRASIMSMDDVNTLVKRLAMRLSVRA